MCLYKQDTGANLGSLFMKACSDSLPTHAVKTQSIISEPIAPVLFNNILSHPELQLTFHN